MVLEQYGFDPKRLKLEWVSASEGEKFQKTVVEFVESNNATADVMNGDFRWDIAATNTPPLKSATGVVCYTDAGFAAYFGGEN